MFSAQAPEKTESGAPAAPAEAPLRRRVSPMGSIAAVTVLAVTAVVVYVITSGFQEAAPKAMIDATYEEMELGQFIRELAPDPANLVREQFMIKVVLVLNSNYKKLSEMKGLMEKRKNLMKDIVWREILYLKSDADLRKASILDSLAIEIKQRINAELSTSKEGQELIDRVIVPESRLPARR